MHRVLQPICLPETEQAGVLLYLKREDLMHPVYGGNKVRKLKYNVEECLRQGKTTLLTCGGAYSNHILAVAAYGAENGVQTKAIIRGDELSIENPTLKDAAAFGMQYVFADREQYRALREQPSLAYAISGCEEATHYFIPEGGTNALAIKGVAELVNEIDIPFDYIATPCGSGGTFAGLLSGLKNRPEKVLVFSALKNGDYVKEEMKALLNEDYAEQKLALFTSDYCFGGYAKMKPELLRFVQMFQQQTSILLDPIYNGKMMYGLLEMIRKGHFKKGTVIIGLHTGGTQAWRGYGEGLRLNA